MEGCVFCKIVAGEIPCEKVFENEGFIVIADAQPQTEGHSLVISKKHYKNFMEMPKELYGGMLSAAKEAVGKLGCDSFNLVVNNGKAAQQLVPHVHLHIVPRKEGDGYRINF